MIEYLSEEQVLHLHRVIIAATGGAGGVRDQGCSSPRSLAPPPPSAARSSIHRCRQRPRRRPISASRRSASGSSSASDGVMAAAWLVAAAAIGLAGCSGDRSGSDAEAGVAPAVSFPLAEPVTLTVGVPESLLPQSARPSWEVLQRRTNIRLRPVAIDGAGAAARGTRLAELAASGGLPDLLAEGVALIDFIRQREWLVNLLERPELTPNLHRLLTEHERFRQGTHGRLLAPGELYALGVFDESDSPYLGAIAYRQDLFEARGLGAETWGGSARIARRPPVRVPRQHAVRRHPPGVAVPGAVVVPLRCRRPDRGLLPSRAARVAARAAQTGVRGLPALVPSLGGGGADGVRGVRPGADWLRDW